MGKYFGTDGFRGEANVNLTVDHARKVGRFLGWYYGQLKKQRGDDIPAKVVIKKEAKLIFLMSKRRNWIEDSVLIVHPN